MYDPRKNGALCDSCPRRTQQPVPPEGNPRATVVWLGQDPGKREVKMGRPFVGPTGKRLAGIWAAAEKAVGTAYSRDRLWVTNTALCLPLSKSAAEAKKAADCCRPRLRAELQRLPSDAWILAMGKWAFYSLTGKVKGIGKYIGFHSDVRFK